MKMFDFTSSILYSVPSFFPEISKEMVEDSVHCTYVSENLFLLKITFYMWNFDSDGFEANLIKLKDFLQRLGIFDLDDLISPKIVNTCDEENLGKESDLAIRKSDYREYYFMVPLSVSTFIEQ